MTQFIGSLSRKRNSDYNGKDSNRKWCKDYAEAKQTERPPERGER